MEALVCKACGAALTATGLDPAAGTVSCVHCGALFRLDEAERRALGGAEAAAPPGPRVRERVPLPRHVTVERLGRRLVVRWRWFRWSMLPLLFFALVWDGFLVAWYSIAFSSEGRVPWIALVFPLLHVLVGIGVTYGAALNLLERTTVEVDGGALSVTHGPLPWGPSPTVPVHEIEQIFVARTVRQSKNGPSVSWELRAVTRKDRSLLLARGLAEPEQAWWLEQEIEEHLGLADRPVAGEQVTPA